MAVLVVAAEAVSPHWIPRFLRAVLEYPAYGADQSVVQLFLPSFVAKAGDCRSRVRLCVVGWHWRKASPGSEDFAWALAWVSAVTMGYPAKKWPRIISLCLYRPCSSCWLGDKRSGKQVLSRAR